MGELIAVLSGKGGTGKTSVCAAVSTALARMGHRVLAIDCDMGLQNLDISLCLSDTGAISFLDVCEGGYRLDQAAKHHQFPALSFLTAPLNRTAESVDADGFKNMVRTARREFDYIFLDAPAGIDAGFELAAKYDISRRVSYRRALSVNYLAADRGNIIRYCVTAYRAIVGKLERGHKRRIISVHKLASAAFAQERHDLAHLLSSALTA